MRSHLYSTSDQPTNAQRFQQDLSEHDISRNALPYTRQINKTLIYRLAFSVLSSLLFFLTFAVFIRSPNCECELYIGYCWLIKILIGGLSGLLGTIALTLSAFLRTENEAALSIAIQSRRRLRQQYRSALSQREASSFWWINSPPRNLLQIQHLYQEAKHQLSSLQAARQPLLREISRSTQIDNAQREHLFNEALRQLKLSADEVIEQFRNQAAAID